MTKKQIAIGAIVAIFILTAIAIFFLFGNANKISDIKNSEHMGKTVIINGVVQNTIKIGSLSGYTLKDDSDSIAVSDQRLPKEGDTITVKGVLIHDTILGYYIKAD